MVSVSPQMVATCRSAPTTFEKVHGEEIAKAYAKKHKITFDLLEAVRTNSQLATASIFDKIKSLFLELLARIDTLGASVTERRKFTNRLSYCSMVGLDNYYQDDCVKALSYLAIKFHISSETPCLAFTIRTAVVQHIDEHLQKKFPAIAADERWAIASAIEHWEKDFDKSISCIERAASNIDGTVSSSAKVIDAIVSVNSNLSPAKVDTELSKVRERMAQWRQSAR
ncbi:MAG: hypothetical protein LBI39_02825 [Puniceicoccales bacterium]|jgi:hypothetical protein|nr:hypothetical protein [Puniceicoccales bacterium]